MRSNGETWCENTTENSDNCQKDQKLSKLCSDAGLKLVEIGQYFNTLDTEEGTRDATFMPRIHHASIREEDSSERVDSQEYENRSGLGYKSRRLAGLYGMMENCVRTFFQP